MRRNWRPFLMTVVPFLLAATACVEPNDGSKIELLLESTVHVPLEPGAPPVGFGQPPPGTHYEMWVARDGLAEKVFDFILTPIVHPEHPCMIEDEFAVVPYSGEKVAGLHVTQWGNKLLDIYQKPDSLGGTNITDDEAGALYDAQVRLVNLGKLEEAVTAVVSHDPTLTEADEQAFIDDVTTNAPIDDISPEKAAIRQRMCREFFAEHPDYYVGADRLITLPLNGLFYGVVNGTDPRNLGRIGGASLTVDAVFPDPAEAEWALQINWQFNEDTSGFPGSTRDLACDYGAQGTPGETPEEPGHCWSPTGFHYMAGTPIVRTRGVINVPLANTLWPAIAGEAAIYSGLNRDDVHF